MSKFDPEFYRRYRPYYPNELFAPLLGALAGQGPWRVADIGCGTGHSCASLLLAAGAAIRVTGVDPDPAMLAAARGICPEAEYRVGSGEATGLEAHAFEAVTIGSAFHWMDAARTRDEVVRVLRPGGLILVYEYQFPKAAEHAALNEWIRREFNLRWKAPGQKPRGDFAAVTACFREDARFRRLSDRRVPMVLRLGPADLTGLILSQSRVLHYEAGMAPDERGRFQAWLGGEISAQLGGQGDLFDFNLQAAVFGLISGA
jgi:SAM-dependent methyltransferase